MLRWVRLLRGFVVLHYYDVWVFHLVNEAP